MEDEYFNGSDMLVYANGKAFGHCTSHETSFDTTTKERSVKPVASSANDNGRWKGKNISGQSVTINADGLVFYEEEVNGYREAGFRDLLGMWKVGDTVNVQCMARSDSPTPYLKGRFVIKSLKRTDPAEDDSTYSISLENDGEVDWGGDTPTPEPGQKVTDALMLRNGGYLKLRNGNYLKLH